MSAVKKFFTNYKEIPFFYSAWMNVILGVFVYLFWFFEIGIYGIVVLLALVGVLLALCRDASPLAVFAPYVVMLISDNLNALNSFVYFSIGFAVMALGIVVHFIRFKPFRSFGKIKGFIIAAVLMGVAMAIGGIGVKGRAVIPAITVVGLSLLSVAAAFFIYATMGRDDPKRFVNLLLYGLLTCAIVALAQMITVIIRTGDPVHAISTKYDINTGWGHPNYIANFLARGIPVAIYFSTREKKLSELWLLVAAVFGVAIVATSARATLLVALVMSVVCAIYFVPKMEKKGPWLCVFFMIIGLTLIGVGAMGGRIKKLLDTYIRHGVDSSGRFDLWRIALERFKEKPIFGMGFDYDLGGRTELNPSNTQFTPYWYHNTWIQALSSLGIVGTLALILFTYRQYECFIRTKNPTVYALMFCLVMIQGAALLDVYYFLPQDYLLMLVMTIAALKTLPEDKGNSWFYPLLERIKKNKTKEKKQ